MLTAASAASEPSQNTSLRSIDATGMAIERKCTATSVQQGYLDYGTASRSDSRSSPHVTMGRATGHAEHLADAGRRSPPLSTLSEGHELCGLVDLSRPPGTQRSPHVRM